MVYGASLTSRDGVRIATVVPLSSPYKQGGPTATVSLSNRNAHMSDGRAVTGIMIRSWLESGAARVQVYGMVTKQGVPARFTTDESQLEPLEGSYLLRPGQTVPIAEMAKLRVEPLMLRY